jgi:hypothetical protein
MVLSFAQAVDPWYVVPAVMVFVGWVAFLLWYILKKGGKT